MSAFESLSQAVIPASLREDEASHHKAKNLLGLAGAALLAAPPFAGLYAWLGNVPGAVAIGMTLPVLCVCLASMRITQSLWLAQHGSMFTLFALFCYLIWSMGGNPATAVNGWFAAVPLVAAFLLGLRHGLIWLLMSMGAMLGFAWADATGAVVFPVNPVTDPRLLEIISNLGLVPFVAGLALFFQMTKEQSDAIRRSQVVTIRQLMEDVARLSEQVQRDVVNMVGALDEQTRQAHGMRHASETGHALAASLQDTSGTLAREAHMARETAEHGADVVSQAITNTEALAESIGRADTLVRTLHARSQDISSIVDKIKGLAFQTNILALNATIEAAHAGAQGRGFAVVADNVRKLASEAGDAASDIGRELGVVLANIADTAALLSSSQSLADSGRNSAARAKEALQSIQASVAAVHAAMDSLQDVSAQQFQQHTELQAAATRIEQGIQQVAVGSGSISDAVGRLNARLGEVTH